MHDDASVMLLRARCCAGKRGLLVQVLSLKIFLGTDSVISRHHHPPPTSHLRLRSDPRIKLWLELLLVMTMTPARFKSNPNRDRNLLVHPFTRLVFTGNQNPTSGKFASCSTHDCIWWSGITYAAMSIIVGTFKRFLRYLGSANVHEPRPFGRSKYRLVTT